MISPNRRRVVVCDVMDDAAPDTRWLSYQELAEARGINRRSAVRLSQRHRWRRRKGNDGTTRVAVPVGEDQPKSDDAGDAAGVVAGDVAPDISSITKAFQDGLAAFREQVEVERQRVDQAQQALAAMQGELAEAKAVADAEKGRGEQQLRQAEQARDAIQAELTQAQDALREVEATRAEFWRRGRFARAWSAWTGRR